MSGSATRRSEERQLALAAKLAHSGDVRGQAQSRAILANLERARREAEEDAALAKHLADTVSREIAQGEDVEVSSAPGSRGRVRILSRDGLQMLRNSGRIDAAEHQAGLIYRRAYEGVQRGGLRSQLDEGRIQGGSGPTTEALTLRAHHDAMRVAMEGLTANERERTALRLVAGEGRCVSHLTKSGSAQAAYAQALGNALNRLAARYVVGRER